VEGFWPDEAKVRAAQAREADVIISPDLRLHPLPHPGWLALMPKDVGLAWLACTNPGHVCSGIFRTADDRRDGGRHR